MTPVNSPAGNAAAGTFRTVHPGRSKSEIFQAADGVRAPE